ncbi:hypothetical protein RND81_10G245600 [Saponaria officinalis]|uniref:F-box domain-containing protein n=1 Tax=Saponaria officinalis TaxID=3572 RepID=A0AAW1I7C0_SAPOF
MASSLSDEKSCYCPISSDDSSDIHIPPELLYNILSRLPSKSLMRFRCVCKSWYSFITHDLEFHKLHLLNFNLNNKDPRWMGYQLGSDYDYRTTKFWLYDESFHSDNIQACHFHWEETTPVDFFYSVIVSSCNGIVCLYHPVNHSLGKVEEEWGFGKFLICLLNPSIRKYRRINFPRINFPWKVTYNYGLEEDILVGFGLSIKSNIYMILVDIYMILV